MINMSAQRVKCLSGKRDLFFRHMVGMDEAIIHPLGHRVSRGLPRALVGSRDISVFIYIQVPLRGNQWRMWVGV